MMVPVPVQLVPQFGKVLDARCSGPISQRASIATPLAVGLQYWAKDEQKLYVYNGIAWVDLVGTLQAQITVLQTQVTALQTP